MNKNIKRIVLVALVFGTFSALAPATSVNLLTTRAYASSDDENGKTKLDGLRLETSSGNNIKLYSDSSYDKDTQLGDNDTPDEDTYYAKTSSSTINIKADGPNSRYVKVFKGTSSSTKGKSISSDISLSSDTTTLVVRVYHNKPNTDVRYDDDDVASEYKIKVKYIGNSLDSEAVDASEYDDIYLDKLSVNGDSISLSDSKIKYSYNVASNVDQVTVKASPKDEDYDTVKIDGSTVYNSENYKKTISLNNGDNKINIQIEDDDDNNNREYTLNIIKGTSTAVETGTSAASETTTNVKANQWVSTNAGWQYHDSTGIPVKGWYNDKNNGYWYYLGVDGIMQTGWIIYNGKYYYLNSDGSMACNTQIGLYKLGNDGAWIN